MHLSETSIEALEAEVERVSQKLDRLKADYDRHLIFGTFGSVVATGIFLGLIAILIWC